ncbi:hypothetical protein JQX13_38960 [Archangium violaceum]|uniref:hypothetical protein n=1 Tax=Archangium violaceum TaxID=83451 RepID=UPI00193B29F4|nr:hypothetical protein [Archangium violaceum]QRK06063.1 hypothetical protein JQX13_38960 [Archangium violaceum]
MSDSGSAVSVDYGVNAALRLMSEAIDKAYPDYDGREAAARELLTQLEGLPEQQRRRDFRFDTKAISGVVRTVEVLFPAKPNVRRTSIYVWYSGDGFKLRLDTSKEPETLHLPYDPHIGAFVAAKPGHEGDAPPPPLAMLVQKLLDMAPRSQ